MYEYELAGVIAACLIVAIIGIVINRFSKNNKIGNLLLIISIGYFLMNILGAGIGLILTIILIIGVKYFSKNKEEN